MIGRTRTNLRRSTTGLLAAIAITACSSRSSQNIATAPAPAANAAQAQGDAAAVARARADSVRLPWTAADARFMSAMIGHHSQAIVMSRMAPTRAERPAIKRLAERVISAQEDEIVTMQRWLQDRAQPVPDAHSGGTHSMAHGAGHSMQMPGMLTDAQLKQLENSKGDTFDRLFLTYMIQHHRGAVAMVTELFATTGAGQDETIFKFATDVNVDQATEIARMERMLVALLTEGNAP